MAERPAAPLTTGELTNSEPGLPWKKIGIASLAATTATIALREYRRIKTFPQRKQAYLDSLSGNQWDGEQYDFDEVLWIDEVTPAMRQLLDGIQQTLLQDEWQPVAVVKRRYHGFKAIYTDPARTAVTDEEPEVDFLKPDVEVDPEWNDRIVDSSVEKINKFLKDTNIRLTDIDVSYGTDVHRMPGDRKGFLYWQTGVIEVGMGYEDFAEEFQRLLQEEVRIAEIKGSIVDNPSKLF